MKTNLLILSVLVVLLPLTGCKKAPSSEPGANSSAQETSGPGLAPGVRTTPLIAGARKTSFHDVTARLDPGGSLFLYLATDQWLATLATNISQLREVVLALPGPGMENRQEIERGFDLLARLVQGSGIQDVTGVGMSAAPIAPGLFRNKFILHHPQGAGQGFLWSMFGRSSHSLAGVEMLPANTALAGFGDLDVAELWRVLQQELAQSGMTGAADAARTFPQIFEKQTQIPWEPLLASLGGEIGVVLTLDDARKIVLPAGPRGQIQMPAPGLLVAMKVKSDVLYDRLSAIFQTNLKGVVSEEAGLKMCSMTLPIPLPIPLQPTVASSGDYFFFATTPELVQTVQAVRKGKAPGLKKSADFQALAAHLPKEGNQFFFAGKSFAQTVGDLQRQTMAQGGMPEEQMAVLQRLFGAARPSYSLSIGAHASTGWETTSVSTRDSAGAALVLPAVAVTAIGAGMLLPALAKAKSRAQTINSVNEMKQLGLAARMYANDHKDTFPNAQTWCDDLKAYVGGGKVYKAPNDPGPGPCSFAYNQKLSGLDEAKIDPQTVLFFECESGWNRSGGSELLLPQPRSGGVYIIGLADGSVQQMTPARVRSLRWDP